MVGAVAGSDPEAGQDETLEALCAELRRSLGGFGYQWLCACAVHPGLRFTLSVWLGRELALVLRRPMPTEDELLALFWLPWFRKGWMPQDMRLRLVADLVPEARAAVRRAIERLMLAAIDAPVPATPLEPLLLPPPPATWNEQVRAMVETASPAAVERDLIFARFLAGQPVDRHGLARDRWSLNRFGIRIESWLDRRTVAGAMAALALSFLAFWQTDAWVKPYFLTVVVVPPVPVVEPEPPPPAAPDPTVTQIVAAADPEPQPAASGTARAPQGVPEPVESKPNTENHAVAPPGRSAPASTTEQPIQDSSQEAEPRLIGRFNKWNAFSFLEKGGRICYSASQPSKIGESSANRGDIYTLITHRVNEKIYNVPSIIMGYKLRRGTDAEVKIGQKIYYLFVDGETAWARDAKTDSDLTSAISEGSTMSVTATLDNGQKVTDIYSLSGSRGAYQAISDACAVDPANRPGGK